MKWGDIQAAELLNSGKTYRAFRYRRFLLRCERQCVEARLARIASAVQSADHLRLLKTASASDSGYQPSASRRRLRRSHWDPGASRGQGHRDVRRLGRRIRESRADQALRWAHYRLRAPVEDCRWGPRWQTRSIRAKAVGQRGPDRSRDRSASSFHDDEGWKAHQSSNHASRSPRFPSMPSYFRCSLRISPLWKRSWGLQGIPR